MNAQADAQPSKAGNIATLWAHYMNRMPETSTGHHNTVSLHHKEVIYLKPVVLRQALSSVERWSNEHTSPHREGFLLLTLIS